MKKCNFKSFLSLLMVPAAAFGLSVSAMAASPEIAFENGKIDVRTAGSAYTDTDLFDGFKGVMPGDVLTEEITVQNNTSDCDYIKVYMRAVPHDGVSNAISDTVLTEIQSDDRRGTASEQAYMQDFLSQLSVKVSSGTMPVYTGSADMTAGLTENVYLGTIRKGESLPLNVELAVPLELDNTYSDRVGEVDWVFVAEGLDDPVTPTPAKDDDKDRDTSTHEVTPTPQPNVIINLIQTGQLNWPVLVMSGLGILLIACGVVKAVKRRKNDRA